MVLSGQWVDFVQAILGVWFGLLCRAAWKSIKTPVTNPIKATDALRARLSTAGLVFSAVAVASLICLHATWISPSISQRLGVTSVRVFALFLFFPTLFGLLFSILGSGKARFLGIATCLITGIWWYGLWFEAAISMGAPLARHSIQYLVPAGYVGWFEVKHSVPDAPSLPLVDGTFICRIPADGLLRTSSALEEGWSKDRYLYYMADGSVQTLKATGWGDGGMIWGGQNSATDEYFYVGTEQQFHNGVSVNKIRPF